MADPEDSWKKVWLGSNGPFLYDENESYNDDVEDPDYDPTPIRSIRAEGRADFIDLYTEGKVQHSQAPEEDNDALRKQDLDGAVSGLAVGETLSNSGESTLIAGFIYGLDAIGGIEKALAAAGSVRIGLVALGASVQAGDSFLPVSYGRVIDLFTSDASGWEAGQPAYLSASIAGQVTNIRPTAPDETQILGVACWNHVEEGKIRILWNPQLFTTV